jgi:exonuclease VII small subunit
MQIFTLIPSGTWASILILVIVSGTAISLRLTLYKQLEEINRKTSRLLSGGESEGIQPAIVDRLRERYQKASQKLEHVNTPALIDSVYKEERVKFLFFNLQYDRADGITRALPNLLIAFGLIGTFWGITSNLTNISSIVTGFSQSNPDISKLVQGLQLPLRDMGVAFSTSLFGLLAGSILTIINTIWSINIAKYQLISGLEDYLDNIYKPTVEGNTRLDLAIDRMVIQQQEFLTRFHENVGSILEASFGKAANQIADECGRINKIAENVYTNFSNAAGTISTGASIFKDTAQSLESQSENLAESLHEFKSGVEIFNIAANGLENNNIIHNLDRVLVELNTSQQAFTNSTQTLENSLEGITSRNKTAAELAEKIYQNLHTSIASMDNSSTTIERSANTFSSAAISMQTHAQTFAFFVPGIKESVELFDTAANKLEQNNIIQNLDRVLSELNINQQAFANSTQILQDSLIGITTTNQTAAQLAQQVYETWQDSTNQIVAASEAMGAGAIIFQTAANSLEGQTQTVIGLMPELKNGVDTFASAANKVKTNNIIKHLNTLVENLSTTQEAFTNSTQILTAGLGVTIVNNQEATKLASQIYQGLGESTQGMQLGAKNLLDAAQIIQDSQLGIELNRAATEFTNSTEIFSQAANNLQPVAANLEPAIASIDRAINSLEKVGSEVVSLSKNTAQASESTQTAILGFDRNYQQVLTNTESSIQDFGKINRANWHSLIDILEKKLQTDRSQNSQSIEAMKEHFTKMSLPDPDSLARLLSILEKLENVLNTKQSNDSLASNGNRKSGFFGIS